MKKSTIVLISILALSLLFTGCSSSAEQTEEKSYEVYSFSGENDYISVSNGVIIIDTDDEICYGGDLEVNQYEFINITAYTATIYIDSGSEKEILLSNSVEDDTGGILNVSGAIGKISGDVISDSGIDKLAGNLWFELETTALNGEENIYQLKLDVSKITEDID